MSDQEPTSPIAIGEIEQGPSKFEEFLDRNQKNLIFGGIALIAIVALYIIFTGASENKQLNASAALVAATDSTSLKSVAEKYEGTAAGGSALIKLAAEQWSADEKDESIATLKSYLASYADHSAYGSALVSLGSKLNATGQADEAKQYLNDAIDEEDAIFSSLAKILLAEHSIINGDAAAADGLLKEVSEMAEEIGDLTYLSQERELVASSQLPKTTIPEVKEEVVNPVESLLGAKDAEVSAVEEVIEAVKQESDSATLGE